jgi:hypothetical protein
MCVRVLRGCVGAGKRDGKRREFFHLQLIVHLGKFHVEKSPTADIKLLMSCGAVDPTGCILAITLAAEETGSSVDAPQHVR